MTKPHPSGPVCARCGERRGDHYLLAEDRFPWKTVYVCRTAVFEQKQARVSTPPKEGE